MTFYWTSPDPSASPSFEPLNPIADFRLRQVQASLGKDPDRWWSVLIDLQGVSLADFEARVTNANMKDELRIPIAYQPEDRSIVAQSYLAAVFVTDRLLIQLNANENAFGIASIYDGMITAKSSFDIDPQPPRTSPIKVNERTAVVAVIDDGIAFAHDLFRKEPAASRVDYAAVLGAEPGIGGSSSTIGRTFYRDQIDALLEKYVSDGLLDEDKFYRATGQIDFFDQNFAPVSLGRSHGTHVAALAAGQRMEAADDTRPILCVSLPARVTEDTTGQTMLPAVALALQCLNVQCRRYVVEADGSGTEKAAPVVVNFSFGNFAGPHDGTGVFSRLFEQFLTGDPAKKRRAMVLPAGNGNLSKTHAELSLDELKCDASKELRLVVLPDDKTATHMQMWMPFTELMPPPKFVTIEVTPPGGSPKMSVQASLADGSYWSLHDDTGAEAARLSYNFMPPPTQRGYVTLSLAPTSSLKEKAVTAPAGRWRIRVTVSNDAMAALSDNLPANSVQCWVRRDETLPGFLPGGRQAQFDGRLYTKFNAFGEPLATDPPDTKSLIRRSGTLSGFATGNSTIVVGATTTRDNKISDYSAAGPISLNPNVTNPGQMPPRIGPDAMTRGDDSRVLPGVLSAGSSSGSFVRMSGSSVAAPRIARVVADLMAKHYDFDRTTLIEWVSALDGPTLDGPTARGGGMPSAPIDVDLWGIPASALEPPFDQGPPGG